MCVRNPYFLLPIHRMLRFSALVVSALLLLQVVIADPISQGDGTIPRIYKNNHAATNKASTTISGLLSVSGRYVVRSAGSGCDSGYQPCPNNPSQCAPAGDTCCSDGLGSCPSGQNCLGDDQCCPTSAQTCGGTTCCSAGGPCCSDKASCCEPGSICCNDAEGGCCPSGSSCVSGTNTCSSSGSSGGNPSGAAPKNLLPTWALTGLTTLLCVPFVQELSWA
ncbi:hypothetical protein BJ138DRAFT_1161900 [Hygrophoropsis aurantiaca]|uniref:Uncharacterized protein n=1 Tax=Hygrophoropsis aurantiaca TaxID=72124 RepID=A0ACB8A163_9AGAM|nr:hypothetical protein BJ138DRAFT_1161900 [Hygrophoropsis aurantiaca]